MAIFIVNQLYVAHLLLRLWQNSRIYPLLFAVYAILLKHHPLGKALHPQLLAYRQIYRYSNFLAKDSAAFQLDGVEASRLICLKAKLVNHLLEGLPVLCNNADCLIAHPGGAKHSHQIHILLEVGAKVAHVEFIAGVLNDALAGGNLDGDFDSG